MNVDKLIEELERGLDRAEDESWLAFAIREHGGANELLEDLKQMRHDALFDTSPKNENIP